MLRGPQGNSTLAMIMVDRVSRDLTISNCLEVLQFADLHQIEELKVNALKFIVLNLHSLFADGARINDELIGLPIYLLRDIENFLKVKEPKKFLMLDMEYFEKEIDYEAFLKSQADIEIENELSQVNCKSTFDQIKDIYR
mmetsp:Transcript_37533/g.57508  ORF Transcript_37533/g.57508 Transcript_37533/m.57508 type:complete len:140 (-) Transcript_37533:1494-1913(-)